MHCKLFRQPTHHIESKRLNGSCLRLHSWLLSRCSHRYCCRYFPFSAKLPVTFRVMNNVSPFFCFVLISKWQNSIIESTIIMDERCATSDDDENDNKNVSNSTNWMRKMIKWMKWQFIYCAWHRNVSAVYISLCTTAKRATLRCIIFYAKWQQKCFRCIAVHPHHSFTGYSINRRMATTTTRNVSHFCACPFQGKWCCSNCDGIRSFAFLFYRHMPCIFEATKAAKWRNRM